MPLGLILMKNTVQTIFWQSGNSRCIAAFL